MISDPRFMRPVFSRRRMTTIRTRLARDSYRNVGWKVRNPAYSATGLSISTAHGSVDGVPYSSWLK